MATHYEVLAEDDGWSVRRGGTKTPVVSRHRTQQAALASARARAVNERAVVTWRGRDGYVKGKARF